VLDECRGLLAAQAEASSPDEALAALRRFRVLCAVRHGPLGVLATNARIETLLRARGLRTDGAFYRGRPLLITANDHQSGLFNGDLGVAWPDDDGRMMAWFAVPDGAARPVLPLRLPAHETAWAMTVHKSQGSEFDAVLVLLPDRESPLLHAPLLYTAVTRARQRAVLVGEPTLLAAALGRQPTRASGLASMLAATAAGATIQP
jgi:exodeoxyribonuclease V alpha subunit